MLLDSQRIINLSTQLMSSSSSADQIDYLITSDATEDYCLKRDGYDFDILTDANDAVVAKSQRVVKCLRSP
jgi:tRNA A37 threonylcarbamoyladenosine dehydratase